MNMTHLATRLAVEMVAIALLQPNPNNARTHNRRQRRAIAKSIKQFGFNNPILADANGVVIAGHGRFEAAQLLGMTEVPVIRIEHLTEDQKRAYVIADNQLATLAGWDRVILATELQHLVTLPDFEIEAIGFEMPEIDLIIEGGGPKPEPNEKPIERGPPVTRLGDVWKLGPHRVVCGDATTAAILAAVMGDEVADIVFTDPPYNVVIGNFASGSARLGHREFAMASGEMSEEQFTAFLKKVFRILRRFARSGAVMFVCMDWRHQFELMSAFREEGLEHLNTCVWTKDNGGMGSFYRSAHEFIAVLKVPGAKHRNNVELGRHGRNRTNVWPYPSANSFSKASDEGRLNELHPTVKPVNLVADALLDASARGERVLDPFLGSGTTLIAAEKLGRICHGVELDPLYVDAAIRRWQRWTGERAVHQETGRFFDDLAAEKLEANHG